MAVRFIVLLFEGALVELPEAESAYEVLRVELPEHGGDAAARDWFVAAGAEGAPLAVVVRLAVRLPFVLEEGTPVERLAAFLK